MAKGFTFESNADKIVEKIKDKPHRVLNILGQSIVRETKTRIRSKKSSRAEMQIKQLGYWARKKEGDLQIGFKLGVEKNPSGVGPALFGDIVDGTDEDPILETVKKNKDAIVNLIAQALDEIRKERT